MSKPKVQTKGISHEDQESERLTQEHQKQSLIKMKQIRKNHPDCIPIYFVRHKEAPKDLKNPSNPFILFKKQLKIQQAMYNLHKQIDSTGLYFFTLVNVKDKIKYCRLKPGQTIEQVNKRFGRDDYLTVVYSNGEMGMEGVNKMQRILIRVAIVLGICWVLLYGYPYVVNYLNPNPSSTPQQVKTLLTETIE